MNLLRLLLLAAAVWLVVRWVRGRLAAPRDPGGASPADPWKVLGVSRGATPEEITRAYHERMKRYHPDRVADLGEELRRVAHEKTVEIQRAYAALQQER
jgi:preprotein translocase subunit Sec63